MVSPSYVFYGALDGGPFVRWTPDVGDAYDLFCHEIIPDCITHWGLVDFGVDLHSFLVCAIGKLRMEWDGAMNSL